MSSLSAVHQQQRAWALRNGLYVDARGYLATVEANLRHPLSAVARAAFDNGSGSELRDGPSRPAKMKALHSSSALAVNVFDYWSERNTAPLMAALGLPESAGSPMFEAQFPTGLPGNPPNLDLAIELQSGAVVGFESKFTEWLTPKDSKREHFKPKYFASPEGLWALRALPACQTLVAQIHAGAEVFRYLDAPQLLKHALGLATQCADRFSLHYLYFDCVAGKESTLHRAEIDRFSVLVGPELRFRAFSYQQLFRRLELANGTADGGYLHYLQERYCHPNAGEASLAGDIL